MRKRIIIVLLVIFLAGCVGQESAYSFPNRDLTIISIELLYNQNPNGHGTDENNMVLLRRLSEDEIPTFMAQCYQLPTKRMGTPPSTGYGECIAKICYANGDVEIFSTYNIELIPCGSEPVGCGTHYFPQKSFNEVFAQYADLDLS